MPQRRNRFTLLGALILVALLMPALPCLGQTSMFADFKARSKGDVITVILSERTAAQRESGWQNKSSSKAGGSSSLTGGSSLSGKFALDASFNKSALHENESVQSDLLSGTMTAVIVNRDATGNLYVEGERQLSVNGESHVMRISGIVRTNDIRPNNTVMSYQIANASIEYHRKGGITRSFFKPGRIARLGALAILGGAVAYALK